VKLRHAVAIGVASAVAAVACTSGESILQSGLPPVPTTASTVPGATTIPGATTVAPTTTAQELAGLPPCPVDALDGADGPVDITFWHALNTEAERTLQALTQQYNSSQTRVRVRLINQLGYEQNLDKYRTTRQADRPELVQFSEAALESISSSGTIVPVAACIEAERYSLDDFLAKAIDAYTTRGVLWTMPFNVSNPVLYFNRRVFVEAGLDPDDPPTSLEELRAASEAIVSSGAAAYGIALDSGTDSGGGWFLEQWLAKAGELYADNGNGRLAPATRVLFAEPPGVELLTFLQQMVQDGLAVNVGPNTAGTDALFKLADPSEPAAMTIYTSAALGAVLNVLGGGGIAGFTPEDLGIGPMPGPTVNPGVLVGGATLWIVADKGDERTAASWDYIKFLVEPEQQSAWAAATGYVPVRESAVDLDPIRATYANDPRFRVAFDQLTTSASTPTATGPVLGPLREIRVVTSRAVQDVLTGGDPAAALANAAAQADSLIAAYNANAGG
jgi:sn-glycerol 3-phosphate transport system substrate-binding protein